MQPQTLKIYDVIDSSDTSITSNFETPFCSMMYLITNSYPLFISELMHHM